MAHLRKRKNGVYYAFWKERKPNGGWKSMAKSLKTKNKMVAQQRFNNYFGDDTEKIKECYSEDWEGIFKRELDIQSLDPKTVTKYIYHAKQFIAHFVGRVRRLSDFKREHIIEFIGHLQEVGNSPSTVAGYGRSLRKMFNAALDSEYVRKSPMVKVKVGRMEQRQRFFMPEDIEKIIEVAKEDEYSLALVLFFIQTGFRIQEVVDSHWTNVNHTTRTIKVVGKGKKVRIQKIPQLAYEAVLKLSGKWPTLFGRGQKQLYRDLRAILEKAGVAGSPHVFRDTYATYSIRMMPLSTLRERMGHASLVQTDKYTHALNSDVPQETLKIFQDWQIQR